MFLIWFSGCPFVCPCQGWCVVLLALMPDPKRRLSNTAATAWSGATATGAAVHRRGYDWSEQYLRIVQAARRLPVTRFLIDGEAVVCGHDGVADFAAAAPPNERDRLIARRRD